MIIKRVNDIQFDVFFDTGWENWCRFEIVKEKGHRLIKKLRGKSVPPEIMVFLRKKFERR